MADCERCARPMKADTAYVCAPCAGRVAADLVQLAELLPELDVAITRQAVSGRGAGGKSGELRLAFDQDASIVADTIENTITTWARLVAEESNRPIPGPAARPRRDMHGPSCRGELVLVPELGEYYQRTACAHQACEEIEAARRVDVFAKPTETALAAAARWLATQVEWLRHLRIAAQAFDELAYTHWLIRSTVDRRPDVVYLGQCWAETPDGECQEDVYARAGAALVVCRACGAGWDVTSRRTWLLRAARDTLATATQTAYALSWLVGRRLAPATVRSWAHRGRLMPKGVEPVSGDPMYRIGDAEDLLMMQVKPVIATKVDALATTVQRLPARGRSAPNARHPARSALPSRTGPAAVGLLADVLLGRVDDGLSILVGQAVDPVRGRLVDDVVGLALFDVRADALPVTYDGVLLLGGVLQHLVDEGLFVGRQGLFGGRVGVRVRGLLGLGFGCTPRGDEGDPEGECGQGKTESHGRSPEWAGETPFTLGHGDNPPG